MPTARCQLDDPLYRFRFPYGHARTAKHAFVRLRDRRFRDVPLGTPSRFAVGDWVRVRSVDEVRGTLDSQDRLRGLLFTDAQWSYCGGTFQVDRVLRRLLDSGRRFKTISRTVALGGVTCDGLDGASGCGHSCSLYFRDEWLEPSVESEHVRRQSGQWARVRPWTEIIATLDRHGRRDGLSVMPEMERFAGLPLPVVRRAEDVGVPIPSYKTPIDAFILAGARCGGAALAPLGRCDRDCALLWHRDWLELNDLQSVPSRSYDAPRPTP